VEDLGRLALSVEQAGAFISKARWSPPLREMLDQEPLRLHGEDLAKVDSTVALVFQQSLDHVTGGDDDHRAAIVLGCWLPGRRRHPGTLFDADVVANVPLFADLDPLDVDLGLAELEDYSLLQPLRGGDLRPSTCPDAHASASGQHRSPRGLYRVGGSRSSRRPAGWAPVWVLRLAALPARRAVTTFAADRGVAPESTVRILLGQCSSPRCRPAGQCSPTPGRAKAICDRDLGPITTTTFRCRLEPHTGSISRAARCRDC